MNHIKRTLFIFIVICISFVFSKNVMAVCNYSFDSRTGIIEDKTNVYLKYLEYVYKKKLGYSALEYSNYISAFNDNNSDNLLINVSLSENGDFNLKNYYSSQKDKIKEHTTVFTFHESDDAHLVCPAIIAVEPPYIYFQQYWSHIKLYKGYDFTAKHFNVENALIDAISDVAWKDYTSNPTLLVLDGADMDLSLAKVYVYIGYYGIEFDENYNIDSVVDKYLNIEGIKGILDVINDNDDHDSVKNDTFSTIKDEVVKFIDKLDFDSISGDLNELSKFNNNFSIFYDGNDGNFGIRQTLKQYLYGIGSGMSVTQWFNEYAADSKAQYVESLIELLEILNSDEIKSKKEQLKNLDEAYKDFNYCMRYKFTVENCKSECQEYYKWDACKDESNVSACVSAYPNNVCDNKTGEDVSKDMTKSQKDIEEDIKDTIEKKLIEYYENKGIEIGNTDFCDILVGKDNKTGLYPYIKIVLNITRIGGPILVVILTGLDVMKVISSFKDDENKKFWNHLKIRLICLVILILVPTIINFLVKLVIASACKVEI